jgi:hypothetical protein
MVLSTTHSITGKGRLSIQQNQPQTGKASVRKATSQTIAGACRVNPVVVWGGGEGQPIVIALRAEEKVQKLEAEEHISPLRAREFERTFPK